MSDKKGKGTVEAPEPQKTLDDMTMFEVQRTMSKIGVLATMVQTRIAGISDNKFGAIMDLIDIYEQAARAQVQKGIDFRAEGLGLDGPMQTQVNVLVRKMFTLD